MNTEAMKQALMLEMAPHAQHCDAWYFWPGTSVFADAAIRVFERTAIAQAEQGRARPELIEALRNGSQADADGVMVYMSRQACEEAAAILARDAEPVALQGGLSNDDLLMHWHKKVRNSTGPTPEQLTGFALGVEVGVSLRTAQPAKAECQTCGANTASDNPATWCACPKAAQPTKADDLLAQRDELLAVLEMVQEAAIDERGGDFNLTTDQWTKFHAAIAKVKGGAA